MQWRLIVSLIFSLFIVREACWGADLADERTIKVFHRRDFGDATGGSEWTSAQSVFSGPGISGWVWAPLFDGESESSLVLKFVDGSSPFGVLLNVPPMDEAGVAVVGRWAASCDATTFGNNTRRDSIAAIELRLTVDYGGLSPTLVKTNLTNVGDFSAPLQNFRLPIPPPPPLGHIRRITLSIIAAPKVAMLFEDVRLVEHSSEAKQKISAPTAGPPTAGLLPVASNLAPQFDFIAWIPGQDPQAPVVVTKEGDDTYTLWFNRRPDEGSSRRVSIMSMDAPPLTAGDFGATGTINYSGADAKGDFDGSAYFELTASFPDGSSRIVGTTAAFGPCQKITGHSGDRPMQVAMHSEMPPTRLQLQLVCDGIGNVELSNFSFVQFQAPVAAASSGSTRWMDARLIRGAGCGCVIAALLLGMVTIWRPGFSFARNVGPIVMLVVGQAMFAWAMFLLGKDVNIASVAPLFAGAIAWVLPLLARRLVFRRLHERELRKMLKLDAV